MEQYIAQLVSFENMEDALDIFRDPELTNDEQVELLYHVTRNPALMVCNMNSLFDLFIKRKTIRPALSRFLDGWEDYWTTSLAIHYQYHRFYASHEMTDSLQPEIYRMLYHLGNDNLESYYYPLLLNNFQVSMEGTG
jgi:hypothetical protein